MPTTATLNVDVLANTTSVETGMKKASDSVKKFKEETKDKGGEGGGFTSIVSKLLAMPPAALAAAAGFAVMGFSIGKAFEQISAVGKLANILGSTAEEISALGFAAKKSGVDIEEFQTSLLHMQKAIGEAKNAAATTITVFDRIKIDPSKFANATTTQQIEIIAQKMKELPTVADRTALAMEVFGRGAADILPLLNKGAEGIAQLTAKAQASGAVISGETVKQYKEFKQGLGEIKEVVSSVFMQLAGAIAPTLADVGKFIKDFVAQGRQTFKEWQPVLEQVWDIFKIVWGGIVEVLQKSWQIMKDVFNQIMKFLGIGDVFTNLKVNLTIALTIAEISLENFGMTAALTWTTFKLGITKLYLDIADVFGSKVPEIFMTLVQFLAFTFSKIILNMAELQRSIATFGKEGGKFNWDGIAQGFEKAMLNVGQIINRVRPMSPLEKEMADIINILNAQFAGLFEDKLKMRLAKLNEAQQAVKDAVAEKLPDVAGDKKKEEKTKEPAAGAVGRGSLEAANAVAKARNAVDDLKLKALRELNVNIAAILANLQAADILKVAKF